LNPKNSQTPNLLNQIIELTIDSLSYNGGRGVGRYEGIVVFVPQTAPGDRIRARVRQQKPRFMEAELVEIVEASPSRRTPLCPLTDRCGGCSWQHVEYAVQVEQKANILKSSLRNLEKYGAIPWREFVPAPNEFHYRNRIQIQIRGGDFGFFTKRTRDLVSVRECFIAEKDINRELKTFRPDYDGKVELARARDGKILIMGGERDPEAALFSQVNEAQNEALKKEMLAVISISPDWIMDLYAGAGNLTWPLAERFPGVGMHAVEFSRASVERARAEREIPGLKWHSGDVAQVLARLKPVAGRGLIVLDPPRAGVSQEAIREILKHKPQQIVYVSCNPTTFARDAEFLIREGAYRLESVRGLDMFPQTEHLELIASLCAAT
jgi:23S rRNA (uracil1939-C5)-methyltransferase